MYQVLGRLWIQRGSTLSLKGNKKWYRLCSLQLHARRHYISLCFHLVYLRFHWATARSPYIIVGPHATLVHLPGSKHSPMGHTCSQY